MRSEEDHPVREILISKEIQFDAGHRVPTHTGQCRNPHGHRYRVEVSCFGTIQPDGMLVDFGILKKLMMEHVHDQLDHKFIYWEEDELMFKMSCLWADNTEGMNEAYVPFPYIPTAENFARWIYHELKPHVEAVFDEDELHIYSVRVWETPTSMAEYIA